MGFIDKAFEVSVAFSAVDRMTAPMQKMGAEMGVLSARTKETMAQMTKYRNMTFVGAGVTAVGGFMAVGLFKAADAAGELQTSIMGVKSALGLTNAEFQKAQTLAQKVGIPTIFKSQEVGQIMQAMATSGLTKSSVLNKDILSKYVNFADVQAQLKKENAPDVTATAVQMAHQYQLYSPKQVGGFLDTLNAALLHTSESASEFQTTFKYVANQAKIMGMSSSDALATTAWMSRMGLGKGRGGTNMADFLQRSIYGVGGNKADEAMQTAGFVKNGHSVFEDAKGQFVGIPEAVKIMQDFNKRFGGNGNVETPLLKAIFGQQGMRVAQTMMGSGAGEQYKAVQKQIGSTPSVNKTQEALNRNWQGQMRQAKSTATDIVQAFGQPVIATLLPVITNLNKVLTLILDFEKAHPTIMKFTAGLLEVAAAVALVVGPLMIFAGALGYLKKGEYISAGLKMMGSAFRGLIGPLIGIQIAGGPILWIIEAIAVACALLHFAWKGNWGHIREHWANTVAIFKNDWSALSKGWGDFTTMIYSAWVTSINGCVDVLDDFIKLLDKLPGVNIGLINHLSATAAAATKINKTTAGSNLGALLSGSGSGKISSLSAKTFGIPGNALGTAFWKGGLTWVGEKGIELINLPRGAQVIPHNKVNDALSSEDSNGGGIYVAEGAIVIYATPGQSPTEIAKEVIKELGRKTYQKSLSHPAQVIPAW